MIKGGLILIKKINRIKNIASYKDFEGTSINEFKRFNIMYGENGSGKTVLSKLVSLCSEIEDQDIKIDIYDNLFDGQSVVDFELNGNSTKLKKGSFLSEKIYVFNSLFVSNYLYDGNSMNTRRFSTNDNAVTRIESPNIKKLKERNKELSREIGKTEKEGLKKESIDLSARIEGVSKSIRDEWNSQKSLKGKNLVKPENNYNSSFREKNTIQKDIDKHIKELELSQRDDFNNDLRLLNGLKKDKLSSVIKEIYDDVNTEIKIVAQQKIIGKIKNQNTKKIIGNATSWFEDGLKLLISTKENDNLQCPLCDSNIESRIDAIITDYQGYFDESLKELQLKLEQHLEVIKVDRKRLSNRDEVTLNNLISKYKGAIDKEIFEIEQCDTEKIDKLFQNVENDINTKLKDYKYSVVTDLSESVEVLDSYNIFLSSFIESKSVISDYIASGTSTGRIESKLRSLFYEKFSEQVSKNTELQEPIVRLKEIESLKIRKQTEQEENLRKIDEEIRKLQVESERVNEYLIKLNISNFKVSIENQLTVVYTEGKSKNSLKHSLSEGEKTTLAFAYFLSKMSYEVGKENYKDYIVFIDDPISSIDEDRMFNTANMIYKEFETIKQMFISSHSFKFLRIMNNFLKFYNRRKRPEHQEMNVYKVRYNGGSEIINLPEEIAFFTTLYYSKLQLLIKYLDNDSLTEDEKKSTPNAVRIVLESFLSFKFGYLKGNNYGITPGMRELFEAVKNEDDTIFDNLVEVDGINKSNWKAKLDYLFIRYTDMFSHGNPAAVVNDEPPTTDAELRKFCETTISLIKFLDGIHFSVSLNNCVSEIG